MFHSIYLKFPALLGIFMLVLNEKQLVNSEMKLPDREGLKKAGEILIDVGGLFMPNAEIEKIIKGVSRIITLLGFYNTYEPPTLPIDQQLADIRQFNKEIFYTLKEVADNVKKIPLLNNDLWHMTHQISLITDYSDDVNISLDDILSYSNDSDAIAQDQIDNCNVMIKTAKKEGLLHSLNKIHNRIKPNGFPYRLLNLIEKYNVIETWMCSSHRSQMHLLFELYSNICMAEIKASLVIQYCSDYLIEMRNKTDADIKSMRKIYEKKSKRNMERTKNLFKNSMNKVRVGVGVDFWNCDEEQVKYGQLSPIFSGHISSEFDVLRLNWRGREVDEVTYTGPKYLTYEVDTDVDEMVDACKSVWCQTSKIKCNGFLRNCSLWKEDLNICWGSDKETKYEQVKLNYKILGKKESTCNKHYSYIERRLMSFHAPSPMTNYPLKCICDDHFSNRANRYFSLREVTSDIYNNKVIIGVRIAQIDRMFQFQIIESVVTNYGNIIDKTSSWKMNSTNIFNYGVVPGVDYHKITWTERKVNLDELRTPPNTVLTGLKFAVDNGAVKLVIRYTPLHFKTGKLVPEKSKWHSKPDHDPNEIRTQITFPKFKLDGIGHYPSQTKRGFVEFDVSDWNTTLSQTVFPYVDLTPVYVHPPSLLSAASLILRESSTTAGILAIKLSTYNYAEHLDDMEKIGPSIKIHY